VSNELHIGGNAYGPNAVGHRARAVQRDVTIGAVEDDRLRAALDTLRRLVEEHREQIPEADRVGKDLEAVDQEAHDADPDPDRLRDTVKRIIARVGMVGTVLVAADHLRETVESILH
jgi:Family of unknown function (DUF5955)